MPPKRKRNDHAGGNRPPPHRPSDTALGQHDRDNQDNNRRVSGGGRSTRRNLDRRDSSASQLATNTNSRGPTSPQAARPPSSSSQVAVAPFAIPPNTPILNAGNPRSPISSNYKYAVLTEARLSAWRQNGRQEVIEHGIKSRNDEDVEEISTISQEFTRAVLENRLRPADAGECVKQILGPEVERDETTRFGFDPRILFLDTISIFLESDDTTVKSQLRDFIAATELPPQLLREIMDAAALAQLGLIRETFHRLGIRYATNQLYRQANFNLLREESEGYSKLAAELYRTPCNREFDFPLVMAAWERVKGLIGTFDLDVGRVLDIVIDVFSATMLRNIRFYTRFLRISSWWPRYQIVHAEKGFTGGLPKWALLENEDVSDEVLEAQLAEQCHERDLTFWDRAREVHLDAFFELGGRRVEEADLQRFVDANADLKSDSDVDFEWIKTTKTLPPSGNRVAAQLLGFKFRFYTSVARDKSETLPANLYYLAAYLIKIGFISLPDLYPHLWPADDQMDALKERRMRELAEKERNDRQGGEPNALLRAGALPDDDPVKPASKLRESTAAKPEANKPEGNGTNEEEVDLPEPKEAHKADLVAHLLVVGAIPEALFTLGRFPWLPEAYPDDIYPAINRILLHSISKVYKDTRPTEIRPTTGLLARPEVAPDQSGVPKGSVRLVDGASTKILKWPHADGIAKGILYRFYLDEWADNVPICQTADDVFTLCSTLLNISGVNIGRDPTLVKKLAAIGVKSYLQDQSAHNAGRWHDLLRRILVPSLSLSTSNVDAVNAVWELLKHYPTHVRYNIYAECYEGQISRLPAMAKAFKNARLDTLATLKRLSLTNIPSSAKKLAKIALPSPGVVCKVALDQMEAYTNLIEAFVECTKYFTELGDDVLVWTLLSSLGGKQRSRTQETSVLLASKWLQALSKYSGKVFRRYSSLDVTPVIQYVNNQVSNGNSTDLIILLELINSMGGIVSNIDFTDAQLLALSGGEVLRRQTLIHLGDKRYESTKSAARFIKALEQTELASRLLINVAHYRQSAIYRLPENETHIKYLASITDDSQQALGQYVELLRSNLNPEQFDALVPSIPRLLTEFGLEASLAFMIGRASLAYYMTGPGEKVPLAGADPTTTDADGDVSMGTKVSGDAVPTTSDVQDTEDRTAEDGQDSNQSSLDQSSPPILNGRKSDRFLDVLDPIISAVRTVLPPQVFNKVSPEFYVLFWSLQTGDLAVPSPSYNAESVQVKKEIEDLKKDRRDLTRSGEEKRHEKTLALQQVQRDLLAELSACKERLSKTKLLLIKQSPMWFPVSMANVTSVADFVIEECLTPRLLLSPVDADFCHRMVKFLHMNQVPNFKLSALYDRFFGVNRLRSMIFSCTVREAEFLGRFLKLTLGDLSRWHQSKSTYELEATKEGRLGFATAFDDNGKPVSYMEFDQFRDLLWTWHRNLSTALKTCLSGTEWMHIRNAITILKCCLDYFPAVDFIGRQFQQALGKIAEREAASKTEDEDGQSHRVDLSVTANTALSALKKQAPKWVMVQAFRSNVTNDNPEDKKGVELGKNTPSSNLRPHAPEFKPRSTSVSGGTKAHAEEEDGEVKDSKPSLTDAQSTSAQEKDQDVAKTTSLQRDVDQKTATVLQKSDPARPNSSRSSTPKPSAAAVSSAPNARQDSNRPSTLAPAPGLPSRPEVPFPAHFTHDKYGTIRTSREHRDAREVRDLRDPVRDVRDPRDQRDPRAIRSVEEPHTGRQREHQLPDRGRVPESLPRDPPRSERERPSHRPELTRRNEQNTLDRDNRPRDRAPPAGHVGRGVEASRGPRDGPAGPRAMPPPPQPEPQGPLVNPDRARMIGGDPSNDRPGLINPARAALINDTRPPRHQSRDDSRNRNGSRAPSPQPGDRPVSRTSESSRDDRPGRQHRSDHHSREPRNESAPPPTRGGRMMDHGGDRPMTDRPRDSSSFQRPPPASHMDSEDGRLSHQESDYGRLNAIPSITDAPDGPRGRGRNAARGPPSTPGPDARFPSEAQRTRSPERQYPPTGPASSRGPRRGQAPGQFNHGGSHSASPAGAVATAAGMHPERLRQLNVGPNATASPPPSSYPASTANSVPVHPDRMGHIAGPPRSSDPPHRGSRAPLPPLQTPEKPPVLSGSSGQRQSSGAQAASSSHDNNSPVTTPTGPAINDRTRTGGRKQLADINNMLQGGPTARGRNSRSNLAGSDAQVLTGASPISTPVYERPEPIPPNERGANGNERIGRHDHERMRRDHDNTDRPSRPPRHENREHSPTRERGSKDTREYRDRKSGAGGPSHGGRESDREPPRRSGREPSGLSRDPLPNSGSRGELTSNGRDGGREGRHRGDGGNRQEEFGRGGGGGRGGGPGGRDDRRDPRKGDDRGRKRQSEEGFGGPNEKRQRR
ncbi:hypothetical protein DL764_000754 [Monosporascus ibericus]|uniref:THO complex subunit 2 n=1 Tax=Monosporascus ibericus TaxID=155417 RepID=A0A4Q4TTW5_9PEZI|nr:hypothetical protein DL764_000754 [Monosporascus ibericus]